MSCDPCAEAGCLAESSRFSGLDRTRPSLLLHAPCSSICISITQSCAIFLLGAVYRCMPACSLTTRLYNILLPRELRISAEREAGAVHECYSAFIKNNIFYSAAETLTLPPPGTASQGGPRTRTRRLMRKIAKSDVYLDRLNLQVSTMACIVLLHYPARRAACRCRGNVLKREQTAI